MGGSTTPTTTYKAATETTKRPTEESVTRRYNDVVGLSQDLAP